MRWLMAVAADEASAGVANGEADWAANGVPCWADEVASSTANGNGWGQLIVTAGEASARAANGVYNWAAVEVAYWD